MNQAQQRLAVQEAWDIAHPTRILASCRHWWHSPLGWTLSLGLAIWLLVTYSTIWTDLNNELNVRWKQWEGQATGELTEWKARTAALEQEYVDRMTRLLPEPMPEYPKTRRGRPR